MSEELRGQALRLLARREHTRAELERRLAGAATPAEIRSLLGELEAAGLLSDARYAESYLAAKAARFGAARLRHELRTRGVAEALIDTMLAQPMEGELQRATEIWRRKFGTAPANARDYARQLRFLQSRGFSAETLKSLLKNQEEQ